MIATSGAVAAHQILRMLLVARVAEFDGVGGYSLPPRGSLMGEGWGWGAQPDTLRSKPGPQYMRSADASASMSRIFQASPISPTRRGGGLFSSTAASGTPTRNQARDAAHEQSLLGLGFDVLTVWECETPDGARLEEVLTSFFGRP
jgi:hypothetical protein